MAWWEGLFRETIINYPTHLPLGKMACEQLLSVPGLPPEIEMWTRRNQTWYCRDLAEKGAVTTIDFPHREGWSLFNPSITINPRGDLAMIVRSSNYHITDLGHYVIPPQDGDAIKTENYFLEVTRAPGREKEFSWGEPSLIDDSLVINHERPYPVWGLEDCRVFWADGWDCVATVRDRDAQGICTIMLSRIEDGSFAHDIVVSSGSEHQKNWVPLVGGDGLRLITRYSPMTLQEGVSQKGWWWKSPFIARSFRGGTQAILLDNDRRLAVVHESVTMDPYQKIYLHRFVEMDTTNDNLFLRRISDPFVFEGRQIEFAAGMVQLGEDLVISYGVRDAEAKLLRIPLREAMAMLREPLSEKLV